MVDNKEFKNNTDNKGIPRTLKSLKEVKNRGFQPTGTSEDIPKPPSFKTKTQKKN